MILRVRPNPITAAFDLRVFEDACSSNTPSTGTWARAASATKRVRRRSSWSGRNRKKSGTNMMGARNPRTAETAVPRTHPTSHHQGVVARSKRSMPPNRTHFDARRRAMASPSSSNQQAPPPTRSLPELRIRARIREHADRVRRDTRLRDDDSVRRHEGLRERHPLAFSREDANEVAGPNVSGELRNARDREVRPVTDRIDRGVFDDHPRQVTKEVFDRPEKRPNRGFVPVFLPVRNRVAERIERMGIRFPESRRARSTEVDEVPAHAERVTDVRSERPYIGPGFTSDAKQDGSPVDLDRLELVHDPRPLLALHG